MKNYISIGIFIIIFSIITCKVFALTPPKSVIKAFLTKFPEAKKVKWLKENKTEYEANFYLNEIEMSANFSLEGKWIETEKEIPISEIPLLIKKSIVIKYPKCKITGGDIINNSNGTIKYEVDINNKNKKSEVQYDKEGNFIK